jgi:hypothetical protein
MTAANSTKRRATKTKAANGKGSKPPPTPRLHAPKRAYHREPIYSDAVMDEILRRISHGETLTKACASNPDFPAPSTVIDWVHENRANMAERYARARDRQLERWADEVVDKADAAITNPDTAQAVRLALDSRKWLLSKLKPAVYGDRLEARVTGKDGGPLQVEAAAAIKALIEAMPELGATTALPALASAVASGVVEASAGPLPEDNQQ